jgi:hypothetical protein
VTEAVSPVQACPLPAHALLQGYRGRGAFTDCFCAVLPAPVALAELIEAFYTTRLFKLERVVLAVLARAPSSDAAARALAEGVDRHFAVWTVEDRDAHQVLLAERSGATRSWLMVQTAQTVHGDPLGAAPGGHRVYFGSALVPRRAAAGQPPRLGLLVKLLLPLHTLYSKALLRAACRKLAARSPRG